MGASVSLEHLCNLCEGVIWDFYVVERGADLVMYLILSVPLLDLELYLHTTSPYRLSSNFIPTSY